MKVYEIKYFINRGIKSIDGLKLPWIEYVVAEAWDEAVLKAREYIIEQGYEVVITSCIELGDVRNPVEHIGEQR